MNDSVVTLGCRLNLAESESIREMIAGAAERTVVVNSCAVTAEAVRQSRRAVRRLRAANPDARLLGPGCGAVDSSAVVSPRSVYWVKRWAGPRGPIPEGNPGYRPGRSWALFPR